MQQSKQLFAKAKQYIPGGVNSPVRSFNAVGNEPPFIKSGHAAYLIDEDGNRYVDYLSSWGAMILGHAHPNVVAAVTAAAAQGMSFGAPTGREVQLAEKICSLVPSIEKIRMVNSGTEATMTAIRLARGATGKNKIIKFIGCYHGHADCLLVKAGSGLLTFGIPSSPGVPEDFAKHTLTATFNNLDEVEQLFKNNRDDIAALILEPVACNMNCILPEPGFLQGLRELCDHYQSLLIFDEVITGFRIGLTGAQGHYGITPDLSTFGKIIGGGMPVGAYGGRRDIMDQMAPEGPIYQAGTLAGNPLAMAAGLATMDLLSKPGFYEDLDKKTAKLTQGMQEIATSYQIPLLVTRMGSIFGLFFTEAEVIKNYDDVGRCNIALFRKFFHAMLNEGIYLAPSAYEAGFVSAAHQEQDLQTTLAAMEKVLSSINK